MTCDDRHPRLLHAEKFRQQCDARFVGLPLHGGRRDPELQGVVPDAGGFAPGRPRHDPDAEDDAGFGFVDGDHDGHRK